MGRISIAMAVWAVGAVVLAAAHHSYAMFDRAQTVTLSGTVKIWEIVNPHSLLWIYVPRNDEKKYDLWGLEGPGPGAILRKGWEKDSVKPGDKVTVTFHPLKDGRTGGSLMKVTLPDGRSVTIDDGQAIKPEDIR